MKNGFFAYSSKPQCCENAIEKAIKEINMGKTVHIKSWKKLRTNGKLIINEVLSEIMNADFFCADLTGLNDNVLFEIGFAIGLNKPIWLIFDTSHIESMRRYREIDFFSTIGYAKYSCTTHIVTSFYSDEVYKKSGSLEAMTKNCTRRQEAYHLLFLKNQIDTNFSESIIGIIKKKKLTPIIDDATDTKTQSITWYLSRLLTTPAILAEFSTTDRDRHEVQNSKCSTICGIAVGLGSEVLMVCEDPYETPLDYKELLKKYKTPSECEMVVEPFVEKIKNVSFELLQRKKKHTKIKLERGILHNISFGEFLAEHEGDRLQEYYVETTSYSNLVKNEYNIVVGRKGTGKTATLYYLKSLLDSDQRNHVCTIKPISFDLEGLLYTLLGTPEDFEKTYLIESVWKLLIYTEIAKSIYEILKEKKVYSLSGEEFNFIDFVESNTEMFLADFHERIEEKLKEINSFVKQNSNDFKIKVSEILHSQELKKIRDHIINVFDKDKKIFVIIDNLDKSWKKGAHIEYQSKWILGLLGLTGRIIRDLSYSKKINKNIEFHLTIFLRSDIFNYILQFAREPDKIEYTKLKVEDKETLYRIIEERFVELSEEEYTYNDLWLKFFPKEINGVSVKDYIYERIIPRPRDMIFFFNKMKERAILRGHTSFLKEDIDDAYKEYSEWVFSSILVENGITIKQMEDFLYELVGDAPILSKNDIFQKTISAHIKLDEKYDIDEFIDHLVALSILGRETRKDHYTFSFDLDKDKKSKILARKLGTNAFKIHNALLPALECIID